MRSKVQRCSIPCEAWMAKMVDTDAIYSKMPFLREHRAAGISLGTDGTESVCSSCSFLCEQWTAASYELLCGSTRGSRPTVDMCRHGVLRISLCSGTCFCTD